MQQVEPYGRSNGHSEPKSSFSGNLSMQVENNVKSSMGRISLLGNSDGGNGTQDSKHSACESFFVHLVFFVGLTLKPFVLNLVDQAATGSLPGTPRKVGLQASLKMTSTSTAAVSNAGTLKRSSLKAQTMSNIQTSKFDTVPVIVPRSGSRIEPAANSSLFNLMHQTLSNIQYSSRSDVVLDIVPRTNLRIEPSADSRKESGHGRVMHNSRKSRSTEFRKQTSNSDDSENESTTSSQYGSRGFRRSNSNETIDPDFPSSTNGMKQPVVSSEGNVVDLRNIRNRKMLPTLPTETPTNYQYEHCMLIFITFYFSRIQRYVWYYGLFFLFRNQIKHSAFSH